MELNFTVLLDNKLAELAYGFAPAFNVPDLDVFRVSGNLNLPNTSLVTLSNYLHKEEIEDKDCPIYKQLLDMG